MVEGWVWDINIVLQLEIHVSARPMTPGQFSVILWVQILPQTYHALMYNIKSHLVTYTYTQGDL